MLTPHRQTCWGIPPEPPADFGAHRAEGLDLYHLPYAPAYPVVNMEEKPGPFSAEPRIPSPASLFLCTEPLPGGRSVDAQPQRTAVAWAHQVHQLLDEHYPEAAKVRLVCENLNTHNPAALDEAFEPAEAHRLAQRLAIH